MRRLLLRGRTTATSASWLVVALIAVTTIWSGVVGAIGWTLFGLGLLAIVLLPVVALRTHRTVPPLPATVLAAVPFAVGVLAPAGPISQFASFLAVAAAALVVAVELDAFTTVRLHRGVAVAFVLATTVTVAGAWLIAQWVVDLAFGTELLVDNDQVMWRLIAATAAGVAAGIAFDRYVDRLLPQELVPEDVAVGDATEQLESTSEGVTDVVERLGLSDDRQLQLLRAVQLALAALLVFGLVLVNLDVVGSAAMGLTATLLPSLIGSDEEVRHHPGLALWIALAVGLHALGTLAFYQTIWGWHNLAHFVSGTVVAIVGYTALRALETNSNAVSFPPAFTLPFVVLLVFTVGVGWEIGEFTLDRVSAAFGAEDVLLTQHGLQDTMSDLVANTVGALVVGTVATIARSRRRRRHVAAVEEPKST